MNRKQAAAARNADWRLAVKEGRVVRYGYPSDREVTFTSFATHVAACRAVVEADDPRVAIAIPHGGWPPASPGRETLP